jgi:hypothetical protein
VAIPYRSSPSSFSTPLPFFASALLLGLTDEVPDLGRDAFAFGRAHARRIFGDFLGGAFHFLAQLAGACLGLGIEVGDAGYLDKLSI